MQNIKIKSCSLEGYETVYWSVIGEYCGAHVRNCVAQNGPFQKHYYKLWRHPDDGTQGVSETYTRFCVSIVYIFQCM